ncbi:MAG: hypothetical protein IKQ62_03560 [Bacteroidaceae bacterium]|nr:hypothetical protein [Bacteroidaceae bacterium]
MKTKFFMLLAAVLLSASAFAQSGTNGTLKGDVNGDGVVDVADINAIIKIMKDGGGTANQNTWYLAETAMTTDEEILSKDQSYFDGLQYNQLTKPNNGDQIQFHAGYNVMIIPETWGVPVIASDSDFTMTFTSYEPNELGVNHPSGKLLLVYECGVDWNAYIKWNE